ncbi:MAG: hypothetical protein MUC41_11905 [Syntrophobacteraceae bacterium]|nr:hypothetical protein [Syntrophobacteraceae bacterium]
MIVDRSREALRQPVVKPFIIAEIKAFLLQRPLAVPVDLGQKEAVRLVLSNGPYGFGPEGSRPHSPGSLENIRQYQHGHITPDPVTAAGDAQQLLRHGLVDRGISIVQLEGIGPPRKIGVPTMREYPRFLTALQPDIVVRDIGQIFLGPLDIVFGMGLHPVMIQRRVVGHEIEHQPETACGHPVPQPFEGLISAEILINGIGRHRKT